MAREKKPKPEPAVVRVGRDELNLARFPIAMLADRPRDGLPGAIRFEDGEKSWMVAGHVTYGLPTPGDVEVYVCLMELAREQGFPRTLMFSRYDLLQRLGWGRSVDRYERLRLAVARWVHVTITAQKCFYDARRRRVRQEMSFHLLDASSIIIREDAALEELEDEEIRRFERIEAGCWVRFSEPLIANCRKGYVKALDVSLYLSLSSAISQALYRYLDVRRGDGKRLYRERVGSLAVDHLGLSPDYAPSQLKRELERAHRELVASGFLLSATWSKTKDGDSQVIYRFPKEKTATPPPPAQPQLDPLETWSPELRTEWEQRKKRRSSATSAA